MKRRGICGRPTADGPPCRNPPGCTIQHTPAMLDQDTNTESRWALRESTLSREHTSPDVTPAVDKEGAAVREAVKSVWDEELGLSAVAYRAADQAPKEMSVDDITELVIDESDRWWAAHGEVHEHAANREVIRGLVQRAQASTAASNVPDRPGRHCPLCGAYAVSDHECPSMRPVVFPCRRCGEPLPGPLAACRCTE